MLEKLHIKKSFLLVAGSILLLIISYELAFKKTLEALHLNQHLTQQLNNVSLAYQPAYLERQNKTIATVINSYKADTLNYRNAVVNQVAEIGDKERVRIIEVPIQTNLSTNQYLIQKISLKGNFFALLKTLNALQKVKGIGYIRSVLIKKPAASNSLKPDKEVVLDIYMGLVK